MARHNLVLTENHNFFIDQMGDSVLRLPLLDLAGRLVRRGALADQNDVFLLYLAEIPRRSIRSQPSRPWQPNGRQKWTPGRRSFAAHNRRTTATQRRPWEEAILRKMLGVSSGAQPDPDVITALVPHPALFMVERRSSTTCPSQQSPIRRYSRLRDDDARLDASLLHRQRRGF